MQAGVREGNGQAKITYLSNVKPARVNIKLNNVRYIKDCINGSTANTANHWLELQAIINGINIAKNKNVTASSLTGLHGSSDLNTLTNGLMNDNYLGLGGGNVCLTVDLGQVYNLDEIAVWHYWLDGRTYYDNVTSVSTDNSTWTNVIANTEVETASGKRVSAYNNSLFANTGLCNSGLIYTGSAQTLISGGENVTYSNNTAINAGTYTVTATANEGYIFADGNTQTTLSCSIAKAIPTLTLSATSGTVVTGQTLTFTETSSIAGNFSHTSSTTSIATLSPSSYSSIAANTAKTVTITGVSAGTSAITVTFTPTDTTNYNSKTATYTSTITASATIPTNSLCVSRTYTGSAQQLTSSTSGTGYTLSNYSQTNAGTYTITATLTSGYRWSDNTTTTKTFSCSLTKATPTLTLSATSGTVMAGFTTTFTETSSIAGNFSHTSSTTSIATLSPSSYSSIAANTAKTVIVTGVAVGSSVITVTFTPASTVNYNSTTRTYAMTTLAKTMQNFSSENCSTMTICTNSSCPSSATITLTDSRDNKTYRVRKFPDGRCWMIDNLRYGGSNDACAGKTSFSGNGSATATNRFGTGTYGDCRDAGNTSYGYLYNWQAAMQSSTAYYNTTYTGSSGAQGICPNSWYVPRTEEQVALDKVIGGSGTGKQSTGSSCIFWRPGGNFLGTYSGFCNTTSAEIRNQGISGYYWSSSQVSASNAYAVDTYVDWVWLQQSYPKYDGFAVRCIKN